MSIGPGQILLIVVALLLLFGAKRIPKAMSELAKGLKAFRDGMCDTKKKPKKKTTKATTTKKRPAKTATKKTTARRTKK